MKKETSKCHNNLYKVLENISTNAFRKPAKIVNNYIAKIVNN